MHDCTWGFNPGNAVFLLCAGNDFDYTNPQKLLVKSICVVKFRTTTRDQGRVNAVAWSPDGGQIASASDDNTVKVCSTSTGEEVRPIPQRKQNNLKGLKDFCMKAKAKNRAYEPTGRLKDRIIPGRLTTQRWTPTIHDV